MWLPGRVTFPLSNTSYCQPLSHDEEEEPSVLRWEGGFISQARAAAEL